MLRIRYRVSAHRTPRGRSGVLSAHRTRAKTSPVIHPILSLPLPPDEVANAIPEQVHASQAAKPILLASDPSDDLRTATSPAPKSIEAAAPRPSMVILVADADASPVALPSQPETPPSRRLLTTPPKAEPPPAVKPSPYILPNHVLPLALELQIANSINVSGKGPLLSDTSHRFHLGAAAAGVITTAFNNPPAPLPQPTVNKTAGALISFGRRSAPWFDFNVNYQFSRFTETYATPTQAPLATVPLTFQEISGEYLHTWWDDTLSSHRLRPFAGVGAGALLFTPVSSQFGTQVRPSAVVDLGVDLSLHSERISLRIDSHTLMYKAPDFNSSVLSSGRWVATTEPTVGLNFHL